jgi:hypothetical protein
MVVRASPILSVFLCSANTIGSAIRAPPIGEAHRTQKKSAKLLIFLLALRIRPALPIDAESVSPLRLLAPNVTQRQ